MLVSDAVRLINFKVGTIDDITGRAINNIFSNQQVIDELLSQLRSYARHTKGIEDMYTFPLPTTSAFVECPPLALRSGAYMFLGYISRGTVFGVDMRPPNEVYNSFRYSPMQGITNWLMPFGAGHTQYFTTNPNSGTAPLTTTISGNITASATSIPIVSVTGLVKRNGRVTIGTEKILYNYFDSTTSYLMGCVRGVEQTVAATHTSGDTVTENNFFIIYRRLPIVIAVESDGTISSATNAIVLDPCDEHMEGIIKSVAYNLLLKYSPERALPYKIDYKELLDEYKLEIMQGRYAGRSGTNVRAPFPTNEGSVPYGGNILY